VRQRVRHRPRVDVAFVKRRLLPPLILGAGVLLVHPAYASAQPAQAPAAPAARAGTPAGPVDHPVTGNPDVDPPNPAASVITAATGDPMQLGPSFTTQPGQTYVVPVDSILTRPDSVPEPLDTPGEMDLPDGAHLKVVPMDQLPMSFLDLPEPETVAEVTVEEQAVALAPPDAPVSEADPAETTPSVGTDLTGLGINDPKEATPAVTTPDGIDLGTPPDGMPAPEDNVPAAPPPTNTETDIATNDQNVEGTNAATDGVDTSDGTKARDGTATDGTTTSTDGTSPDGTSGTDGTNSVDGANSTDGTNAADGTDQSGEAGANEGTSVGEGTDGTNAGDSNDGDGSSAGSSSGDGEGASGEGASGEGASGEGASGDGAGGDGGRGDGSSGDGGAGGDGDGGGGDGGAGGGGDGGGGGGDGGGGGNGGGGGD
jgi:hypothetical protein